MTKKNEEYAQAVMDLFDSNNLSVKNRLEIIANLLIEEGFRGIPKESLPQKVTPLNLMETVLELREHLGETIDLAMIHQGLVLLMWLENTER